MYSTNDELTTVLT